MKKENKFIQIDNITNIDNNLTNENIKLIVIINKKVYKDWRRIRKGTISYNKIKEESK